MNCTFLDNNIINLHYHTAFFVNTAGLFLNAYLKHHLESADIPGNDKSPAIIPYT